MGAQGESIVGEHFEDLLVIKDPQAQGFVAVLRLEEGMLAVFGKLSNSVIGV